MLPHKVKEVMDRLHQINREGQRLDKEAKGMLERTFGNKIFGSGFTIAQVFALEELIDAVIELKEKDKLIIKPK